MLSGRTHNGGFQERIICYILYKDDDYIAFLFRNKSILILLILILKPVLPRVCTRYEIQSPTFHLPLIGHKFAENSLRYCLIKQLNRETCSFLITAKVHTHSYQGYKIYLKHNAIDHYNVDCNIFECYVCQKLNP